MKKKKLTRFISVGVDPETGKRIRKRIYGTSETALRHAENNLRTKMAEISKPSDIKLGAYADRWLETYKASREKATQDMYIHALKKIQPLRERKLREITATDLQRLINSHAEHPAACQKLKLTLKQIFKRAVKDGLIRLNPAEDLQLPRQSKKLQRALTAAEKNAIKAADLTPVERMYINLLFYCGLRPQEACAVMISDFDLEKGELAVSRAVGYDGEKPYFKTTKTNKARSVPISPLFASEVKIYARTLRAENSLYCVHEGGNLISKSGRARMWKRIEKKINEQLGAGTDLKTSAPLHPYTFRHNYCCECYYRGISVVKTALLMGNSPAMVMQVYTHLDDSREPLENLKKMIL